MDPNEALLLSVQSILDDGELDNAGRNAALAETVKQYAEFTGAPHAKAVIMKRDDGDEMGKAIRPMSDEEEAAFDAHGSGPMHDELRARYDNQLRGRPHLSPEQAFAAAFSSLSFGARDELRAEESGEAQAREAEDAARRQAVLRGVDVGKVDIAALAQIALEGRAAALQKSQPHLTREAAMAAAIDERPEIFKIAREAKRADLIKGNTGPTDAVVARRFYATALLTKHAEELRKAEPALSIQAARIEARRRWPDIAARERA